MTKLLTHLRSGNWRSLVASFLYFDTGFTVWLLFGPLAPYMGPSLHLSPAMLGFLVAVPVLSGAILRIPLGSLYQAMNGRTIALMGIALSSATPLYFLGHQGTPSVTILLVLGVLLGMGGASFAVALPMAGSSYPPKVQGLVLGLAAAGNIGAVLDGVLFPPLARHFGWQSAMIAVLPLLALAALAVFAWAQDRGVKTGSPARALFSFFGSLLFLFLLVVGAHRNGLGVEGHAAVLLLPVLGLLFVVALLPPPYRKALREGDTWAFFLVYGITFGGFVGMSAYIALLLVSLYHIAKIDAGLLMALFALVGASLRPVGGLLADSLTGPRVLRLALIGIALIDLVFALSVPPGLWGLGLLLILYVCFGIGNGATFQLVPLRWSTRAGLMTGLIGAAGGIGGFYLPVILSMGKQLTGSYHGGFGLFAGLAFIAVVLVTQRKKNWQMLATDASSAPPLKGVALESE